jgi:hypothetical protein
MRGGAGLSTRSPRRRRQHRPRRRQPLHLQRRRNRPMLVDAPLRRLIEPPAVIAIALFDEPDRLRHGAQLAVGDFSSTSRSALSSRAICTRAYSLRGSISCRSSASCTIIGARRTVSPSRRRSPDRPGPPASARKCDWRAWRGHRRCGTVWRGGWGGFDHGRSPGGVWRRERPKITDILIFRKKML